MDRIDNMLLKALDCSWRRQETLANNVANAETQGYKRKDVDFQSEMAAIMDPQLKGADYSAQVNVTGEKVTVEKEIGEVAKNTIFFNSVAKITALRQRILDSTLGGGGSW